jgi:hypothetical protein
MAKDIIEVESDRRGGVIWKRTNFQFGPINMNIRMKHSWNEEKIAEMKKKMQKCKKIITTEIRTRVAGLEGRNLNHYTTPTWWVS